MMKSIKNVIELIIVQVLIVSISGCTGATSEKTTEPKTPVSSNEQMLAMTPPMGWKHSAVEQPKGALSTDLKSHECQVFVLSPVEK